MTYKAPPHYENVSEMDLFCPREEQESLVGAHTFIVLKFCDFTDGKGLKLIKTILLIY